VILLKWIFPSSSLMERKWTSPSLKMHNHQSWRYLPRVRALQLRLPASLGEYSALVQAKALDFASAVSAVRARGLAMQSAVPVGVGTMSAVIGAKEADLTSWCTEATQTARQANPDATVEAANFNAPGQIVVSGSVDAVEVLEKLISGRSERGLFCKRLNVSAPFHSSLMRSARIAMEGYFESAKTLLTQQLKTPYIANSTGTLISEASSVLPLLLEQIDHPVQWSKSHLPLFKNGHQHAFEFGPGKVLQGLAKRIAKEAGATFEVTPIFDLESLKTAEAAWKVTSK
jgi:[acyl-carrier-protein] S-malonyltransferase